MENNAKKLTAADMPAYEVIEHREIKDIGSDAWLLRHKKTGARVVLLPNSDENKVFYIGFRTPPEDSTGVAHIIEHTVLCGSKEYPVKDPFIELAKGSLNTFLNAMTYPDKTIYPVASCNDADFRNLVSVYMDAVFCPNIYSTDKIFKQEGWHYEMEDPEGELTINGVVYNEMKGAFSSPDEVLYRKIKESLFPDITYGIESGGDPEVIPDLTYEQYLDFHRRYYHPSNSYIYLYGNADMAEELDFIDSHYLSGYEKLEIDSHVELQKPFSEVKKVVESYPILEEDSLENNTYLTLNYCVGESCDRDVYEGFKVLDYALCSAPGAPLKKALVDKGIGNDVYSDFDPGIRQPIFSIVAKNANAGQEKEFLDTIKEVLTEQVKKGIDKKALLASLNSEEFRFKEADYGRMPKGLIYGIQLLDSWLYDDSKPWDTVELLDTFKLLKERAKNTRFFEELTEKYLLNNTHASILVLKPEKGLTEKKDEELKKKLAGYRDSLSKEEVSRIVKETAELKAYQQEEDSPEDLMKIPMLSRSDMKKEADRFVWEERSTADGQQKILYHDVFTNGIGYTVFVFDMEDAPEKYLKIAHILKAVLGMMDTEHYGYADLNNEINIRTGGIGCSIGLYNDSKDDSRVRITFEVSVKALSDQEKDAFELVREIIMSTKFDDEKRLKEILDEFKSGMQVRLTSAGHITAAVRAGSYVSKSAAIVDMHTGIRGYRKLEELTEKAKTPGGLSGLISELKEFASWLFDRKRLMVDFTGSEDDYSHTADGSSIPELAAALADKLYKDAVKDAGPAWEYVRERKNEAFKTAGQVQYVARCGNFKKDGRKFDGVLHVVKTLLSLDYLWKNIRVLGGAYGCMSNFSKNGDSFLTSYRDPNLKNTVDVYEKVAEFLRNFDADERTMTQFIIGTIAELDTPKTPSTRGQYGLTAYMTDTGMAEIQKRRDELLAAGVEDIRRMADYVDAFMSDGCLCVVGGAEAIESEKELFGSISQIK